MSPYRQVTAGAAARGVPAPRRMPGRQARPHVSVVICAYTADRWDMLRQACASVTAQLQHGDELIVVIDGNDSLLTIARAELTGARVLANSNTKGLSGARNTGVAASRASVVAFLDDDAEAMPNWLETIRAAFDSEQVRVVGTRVEPNWQLGRAPRWFPMEFGWVVGCSYRGQPDRRARVRNPIGASMAIRAEAFAVAGPFAELLGRVGTLPVGCEETEFCIRLAQSDPRAVVLLDPSARVRHFVPQDRQRFRYFVRRCFHEGRSKRAVAVIRGREAALAEEQRYVRVVLVGAVLRAFSPRRLVSDPTELLRGGAVAVGLAATVAGYLSAGRK